MFFKPTIVDYYGLYHPRIVAILEIADLESRLSAYMDTWSCRQGVVWLADTRLPGR